MTIQVPSGTPTAGQLCVSRRLGTAWPLLCLLPGLWALLARPPLPLDELRYLTVGWEMWQRGDFLVPHLNGVAYSHKPPLLFWLMHAGWALFGVNEWWPRLISPLCSLLAAALTARLARELWPEDTAAAAIAPWVLAGCVAWILLGQMLMFDTLLAVFALLGLVGVWRASRRGRPADFALVATGIAGGLLSKGPVILVHVLVPALLAPWWAPRLRRRPAGWYAPLLGSAGLGLLAAGAWALPAAAAGGPDYAQAILWGQTAGRLEHSFAHARPWFAYLAILPAMLLPWCAWPRLWHRPVPRRGADPGERFALAAAVAIVGMLSLFSAKQPHYALPVLAPAALLVARRLAARDTGAATAAMTVATGTAVALLATASLVLATRGNGLDLRRPARAIADLQSAGAEVAMVDSYKGQFGFLGRLAEPLPVVPSGATGAWAQAHPGGWLVTTREGALAGLPLEHYASYPYRGGQLDLWRAPLPGPARPPS